jgi:hypothetical protein
LVAALATVGLILMACGESARPATSAVPPDQPGGADSVPATVTEPSPLPAVEVRDLGTGASTDLAGLLPADRPLLMWFWAPH